MDAASGCLRRGVDEKAARLDVLTGAVAVESEARRRRGERKIRRGVDMSRRRRCLDAVVVAEVLGFLSATAGTIPRPAGLTRPNE